MAGSRGGEISTARPGGAVCWVLFSASVLLAIVLRLTNLGSAPIFLDEDIYFQAAIQIHQLPGMRALLESTDAGFGKPPLPFLLASLAIDLLGQPIVAARGISAFAGALSTALCFALGTFVAGRWVGVASAAVYAVSPYAVLHERMYLQDGPMSALALAAAISGWRAVDQASLRWTAAALVLSSLAIQFKMSAIGLAAFPFLGVLVNLGRWRWRLPIATVLALAPAATYLGLMASPLGKGLTAQNRSLLAPFATVPENLNQLLETILTYFPGPLAWLLPVGMLLAFRLPSRRWLLVLAPIAIWALPWILLSRFTPPRYYLPMVPYLCVLVGIAVGMIPMLLRARSIWLARAVVVALVAVLMVPAAASWRIGTDYGGAAMTIVDDFQNRRGWPSGLPYQQIEQARIAQASAGSMLVYEVDRQHAVAAAGYDAVANGRARFLRPNDPFPFDSAESVYLVIDDDRESSSSTRLSRALKKEPRLELVADARQGSSELGVSLLRLAPLEERAAPHPCGYRLMSGEVDGGVRRSLPTVQGRGSIALSIFSETESGAVVTGDLVPTADGQVISVSAAEAMSQSFTARGRSSMKLRQDLARVGPSHSSVSLESERSAPFNVRDLSVRLNGSDQECVLLRN